MLFHWAIAALCCIVHPAIFASASRLRAFASRSDELQNRSAPSAVPVVPGILIPLQIILTAREESLASMPQEVQDNIRSTMKLSPEMTMRWFSDKDCVKYIIDNYDEELASFYVNERHGSFRGDICRAAVLAREGGFYTDLDVQPRVPLTSLVENDTTFMSSFSADGAVLNAIMACTPGNSIMQRSIYHMRRYYKGQLQIKYLEMGPTALLVALRHVVVEQCGVAMMGASEPFLRLKCGAHVIRMFQEQEYNCVDHPLRSQMNCPPARERAMIGFSGARYGIFTPPPNRHVVVWPRFATCQEWGCGAGGEKNEKTDASLPVEPKENTDASQRLPNKQMQVIRFQSK